MKAAALSDWLFFLKDLTPQDFKGDAVDKYLATNKLKLEDFSPFIYFRDDTYGRNLVHLSDHFEILVLTWLPEQRTSVHDHAAQRCWMMVHSGELTLKNYLPVNGKTKCDLRASGPCETYKSGRPAYIDDGIGVHSIANASKKPAVSIHLYAGPIPSCRVYNETSKCFEWNELVYFTGLEPVQK